MTIYMHQKRPVYQARAYTGQGEGTVANIVTWLQSFAPGPDYIEATEAYDSTIDQMVMYVKVGDTSPVDENTPVTLTAVMGDILVTGAGWGVSKTTYDKLELQFDIFQKKLWLGS